MELYEHCDEECSLQTKRLGRAISTLQRTAATPACSCLSSNFWLTESHKRIDGLIVIYSDGLYGNTNELSGE
jgi:hypothetical protein